MKNIVCPVCGNKLGTLSEIVEDSRKGDNETSWERGFLTSPYLECEACGIAKIQLDMAFIVKVEEDHSCLEDNST